MLVIASEDRCVCCGRPVPEGRMVCWACEHQFREVTKMEEEIDRDER